MTGYVKYECSKVLTYFMMISLDMVLDTLHTITKLGNYSF